MLYPPSPSFPPSRVGKGVRGLGKLQIPAQLLLALDGLEERLEVALAKAARPLTLNHLEEDGWAILHVLGEDLQQIAVVVAIHQDTQSRKLVNRFVNLADAIRQLFVVGGQSRQELDALRLQLCHRLNNVASNQSDMLHARGSIVVEIFLNLRLLTSGGRFIDGELDLAVA